MLIYFASACSSKTHNECWRETGVKRLLFSYANDGAMFKVNRHLYDDPTMSIIVDSGAFTSWTKGRHIDIKEYIDFCCRVRGESRASVLFVNLDVIPGRFRVKPTVKERTESARLGWRNFKMMDIVGLPVIHVFHQHEDLGWLDDLSSASDYIGISPANDVSPKDRMAWLDTVFCRIGDRVKTHGFGVTTTRLMERFPFYSVDSTSWLAPSLYGGITVFAGAREKRPPGLVMVTKDRFKEELPLIGRHVRGASQGYKYVTVLSLRSYLKLEQYITDLWTARGVSWETRRPKFPPPKRPRFRHSRAFPFL